MFFKGRIRTRHPVGPSFSKCRFRLQQQCVHPPSASLPQVPQVRPCCKCVLPASLPQVLPAPSASSPQVRPCPKRVLPPSASPGIFENSGIFAKSPTPLPHARGFSKIPGIFQNPRPLCHMPGNFSTSPTALPRARNFWNLVCPCPKCVPAPSVSQSQSTKL